LASREDLKIWIAVRRDLNMSPGKVGAQCSHAAVGLVLQEIDIESNMGGIERANEYLDSTLHTKIVVGVVDYHELWMVEHECDALGIPWYTVTDAGRTELEPGTDTVCAFGPARRNELTDFLQGLRLL
jgi:peptidyl-tRNA hydrolase, PTH2 family